jgi:hypothetical protein
VTLGASATPNYTLTVLYTIDGVDTTDAPALAGTYPVKVQVKPAANGLSNFEEATVTLKSTKGAPVSEGTYLVKGALVGKDGSKVKVSSILGVAR